MKYAKWSVALVAFVLMAATAFELARFKNCQKLGTPGVKLAAVPAMDELGRPVGTESVCLPVDILNGASKPGIVSTNEVTYLPKDTTFGKRIYQFPDGFWTSVSVVLMGADRSSIHQPQFCLVGQGWSIDQTDDAQVPMSRPHPYSLPAKRLTLTHPSLEGKRGLYVYWFVTKDKLATGQADRFWSMAKNVVTTGVLERWAYISFFTVCDAGKEEAAFARMKEIIAASVPQFQEAAGQQSLAQKAPLK